MLVLFAASILLVVAILKTKPPEETKMATGHVMTVSTAYVLGASRSYPIMRRDLKERIQNATNGKVFVKPAPVASWAQAARWFRRFRVARSRRLSTRCRILHPLP
jgi:hypothetical protein